jgi:hypothetical protein
MKVCLPLFVVVFILRERRIGKKVSEFWQKRQWGGAARFAVPMCRMLLSLGIYLIAWGDLYSELMTPYNGQLQGIGIFYTHSLIFVRSG